MPYQTSMSHCHDNDEGYNDDSVVPADIEDDVEDPLWEQ